MRLDDVALMVLCPAFSRVDERCEPIVCTILADAVADADRDPA